MCERNARENDRHAQPLHEAYGFMQHEERHGQTRRKLGSRQDRGQAGRQVGRTESKKENGKCQPEKAGYRSVRGKAANKRSGCEDVRTDKQREYKRSICFPVL